MELVNLPAIGEVIREYRLKAGLTQARLGEMLELPSKAQQRVAGWENGERTPAAFSATSTTN